MKTIAFLTLLLASSSAFAASDGAPVKKPLVGYMHLSQNSPFTVKPPPPGPTQTASEFEDWALGGVSKIDGGYMVTLVHKKNQGETQVIKPRGTVHSAKDEMTWLNPGDPKAFKVEKVTYGKTSWKDTTVLISAGGKTGTMKFDDKQIVPAASAAPGGNRQGGAPGQQQGQPGQPGQPPNPPGVVPQQPGATQGDGNNGRPPRQRVLPPAPTTQQQQTQGQGGRRNR